MKKMNQKGFSAVEIVLVLIIIGLIAGIGWMIYSRHNDKKTATPTISQSTSPAPATPTPTPAQTPTPVAETVKLSITPYNGSKFDITTPKGWEKMAGGDSHIEKTIENDKYLISFQIAEQDYLKLPAYNTAPDQVIGTTTTSKGTKLSVIKISNKSGLAISSCIPTGTTGCSILQNGKPMLIMAQTPGAQAPGSIDFTRASAATLGDDLKSIAASLPF